MNPTASNPVAPALPTTVAAAPTLDVGLILRFFTALVILVAALSVQLWSRLEVRNAAVRLDAARSALALAHSEQDRLQVEVTVLRAPSRLGAIAAEQGLVAPARTLTLGGGRL